MTEVVFAIGLVAAAAGAVAILERFARSPVLVAGVILIYVGLSQLIDPGAVLVLGSINVFIPDILYSLVAGATFIRILGLQRLSLPQMALIGIALLALFSLARGLPGDVATATNEFRRMFFFLSAALYFATVQPTKEFLEKITRFVYAAALLLLVAATVLWVQFLTGASLPELFQRPAEGGFRVLHGDRAMLLAQVCLIALPAWAVRRHGERLLERGLVIALIPAIVLLQWTVVWILFVVGLAVLASRSPALRRKSLVLVAGTAAVGVLALSMIFARADAPDLEQSLEGAATGTDTLLWRVEGWRELTRGGPASISEAVLGAPYGQGWARVLRAFDQEVDPIIPPHNFYLDHYLRHGLLGLLLFLSVYTWAIPRLKRVVGDNDAPGLVNPTILLMLLTTQLVFFITFTPTHEQGLLAGIALSVAIKGTTTEQRPTRTAVPKPDRAPAKA